MSLPFDNFRHRFIALSQFDPTSLSACRVLYRAAALFLAVLLKEN
jgi:hypothetical protein